MSIRAKRNEVPLEQTWDLTTIFASDADFEKALAEYQELLKQPLPTTDFGEIDATTLLQIMQLKDEHECKILALYSYAKMHLDVETTNNHYRAYYEKILATLTTYQTYWSFLDNAMMQISLERYTELSEQEPKLQEYRLIHEKIVKQAEHLLTPEIEEVLARFSKIYDNSATSCEVLVDSDLKFEPLLVDGKELPLNHNTFYEYLHSADPDIRKQAYDKYYAPFMQFKNTLASTLAGEVKKNNLLAALRKYPSARAMALGTTFIPETVYDKLIECVHKHIDKLHRLITLRSKCLGQEKLRCCDLSAPLVGDVDYKVSFEEAKEIVFKALEPLGYEYQQILHKAFDERWIDYADNEGKSGGAYSSGGAGVNPFILLNWTGTLNDVYTLVHELGHSCHTYLACKNQPVSTSDYTIFLAEIASTCNENLLTNYLLATNDDPKLRLYIIDNYLTAFRSTVFRQTQFAEFEHSIYQVEQKGEALTSEVFDKIYGDLEKFYYGPSLDVDEQIVGEWARIPHFYSYYYVYQYATGLAAASTFAKRILQGGLTEAERYLDFLRAGSSDYPIEVLKTAGLDMTESQALEDAMQLFGEYLDLFEQEYQR